MSPVKYTAYLQLEFFSLLVVAFDLSKPRGRDVLLSDLFLRRLPGWSNLQH